MINWASFGKFIVKAVTHTSVNQVVMNVVNYTTPKTAHQITKISTQVGGFIISSMIADHAVEYVMGEIENAMKAPTLVDDNEEDGETK